MPTFYADIIGRLVRSGQLDPAASTLVVAGGPYDRQTLLDAGFTNAVISNLDVRMSGDEFAPFDWSFQDGEALTYEAGAFDQVIEHAGLHHCASPHRALLEMYRVASKAVLVFENRDSFSMRLAKRLGLTHDYELEAVVANDYRFGGVRNSATPNFVYRWTEQEVIKALSANDPLRTPEVQFFYNLRLPVDRIGMHKSSVVRAALKMATVPATILSKVFAKQGNEFGFFVRKSEAVHDWIDPASGGLSARYSDKRFVRASR